MKKNNFKRNNKENWDFEMTQIEDFFTKELVETLSQNSIKNDKIKIIDPKKFITNHIAFVKANRGKQTFRPYLDRLIICKLEIQNRDSK